MSVIKSQDANKDKLSKYGNFLNVINQNKSLLSDLETEENKLKNKI